MFSFIHLLPFVFHFSLDVVHINLSHRIISAADKSRLTELMTLTNLLYIHIGQFQEFV